MAGNLIQVVYGALLDASSNTSSAQSKLADLSTTVTNAVNQFNGNWTGAAHDQFESYYQQYNQAAQDLQEWLTRLASALTAAEQEYQQGDQTVGNIWA